MSVEEEDMAFAPGAEICSSKHVYVVTALLGEGGFGAVYLVYAKDNKDKNNKEKKFAVKVERKKEERRHSKLKMEIAILKVVTGRHFTKIVDRGKNDDAGYFFLVMELVGKSLSDLKLERKDNVLTFGCGLGVGSQCLEAVECLHNAGYIHRDIKPQNFACGLENQRHLIYILDFGIARKYKNSKNEIKTPREHVGFKGTVRFAPLNCHRNNELGPKDDCESWFYLVLDLILPAHLPWRRCTDKGEVMKWKEEVRKEKRNLLFDGLARTEELSKVLEYIDSRQYQDRVDYDYIYRMFKETGKKCGVDIDGPFDWELPNQ